MGTPLYHPRPERWPQFTLRGLLVATVLVALLMPQLVAEYRRQEGLQKLRNNLMKFGGGFPETREQGIERLKQDIEERGRHSGLRPDGL